MFIKYKNPFQQSEAFLDFFRDIENAKLSLSTQRFQNMHRFQIKDLPNKYFLHQIT